jgi:pyruvate/2-oxoacid:ferredoxin oxidoreductase beta subunit
MDTITSTQRIGSYLVEQPKFPFCKGCSHTSVLRKLNDALVALQIPFEHVALVTDIGCIGLADALFENIHTVHTTHGRSTAFATGIALADAVLADRKLKTIVLIGDGGAMIGLNHLVHAASLNVDVTVLICNNFVYGMTGGQGSALTPECFVTATTPRGNTVPPVDLCGILKSSNAAFVARTTAMDNRLPALLNQAIAFEGFAVVEILELCTEYAVDQNDLTGKKLREIANSNGWQLGLVQSISGRKPYNERLKSNASSLAAKDRIPVSQTIQPVRLDHPVNIVVAGSAGERVQSSAAALCQAAVASGLHVTQKNDNPVTQGSGFSLSEVWISPQEIQFTGIEQPEIIVATSAEGLRELESNGTFNRASSETAVYFDSTLAMGDSKAKAHSFPFRKIFGTEGATLGALMFVALRHNIVRESVLRAILKDKFPTNVDKILCDISLLEPTPA